MRYDYTCKACGHIWEESVPMSDRDVALSNPCPECKETGQVHRGYFKVARISYDGAQTIAQRAGSGWNDTLLRIKEGSAKSNTIQTR